MEVWRLSKKFGLSQVRRALGRSSFVGVRQSRWRYVVLVAQDSTTLFHWSWAGVRRPRALRPPHGREKRISEGIEPLPSSSGKPTFCEVQATARLTQSPTILYPLGDKCTRSLERVAPCTIHSSLLQISSGVRTILISRWTGFPPGQRRGGWFLNG